MFASKKTVTDRITIADQRGRQAGIQRSSEQRIAWTTAGMRVQWLSMEAMARIAGEKAVGRERRS